MKLDSNEVFDVGTCTQCGAEGVERCCVCDDVYVCADCLDSDFTKCDECGKYYSNDVVNLVDDQMLCEYCQEELEAENEEEDESEDEE